MWRGQRQPKGFPQSLGALLRTGRSPRARPRGVAAIKAPRRCAPNGHCPAKGRLPSPSLTSCPSASPRATQCGRYLAVRLLSQACGCPVAASAAERRHGRRLQFLQQNTQGLCCFTKVCSTWEASKVVLMLKNPPASARDVRDGGSIPGLRRSPGGGNGSPLLYSCLENPTEKSGGLQSMVLEKVRHDWAT